MINVEGKDFGRLIILEYIGYCNGRDRYTGQCSCGKLVVGLIGKSLRNRTANSCGCIRKEITGKLKKSHGHSPNSKVSLTYMSWSCMKARVQPNHRDHKYYYDRGITVCDRWQKFENFLEDMGERTDKSLTIDRINNDGNYAPDNCRWATKLEQSKNSRPKKRKYG